MGDSSRRGALVDVLEVFVVEGGAPWASSIKSTFATAGVSVAESREQTELELVGRATISAESSPCCFFQMDPGDVLEFLD